VPHAMRVQEAVESQAAERRALPAAANECLDAGGRPLPGYGDLLQAVLDEPDRVRQLGDDAQAWFAGHRVTFGPPVNGEAPTFPFDPIPRVLTAAEWSHIEAGLSQRVLALDSFVADCYGAQRALRAGVVPARLVYSSTGYLRDLVGIRPPRSTYCHISGIDLVRSGTGFAVLEDNVRIPSGIAYALVSRHAMLELAPQWVAQHRVRSIDVYPEQLRGVLRRIAPRQWDASVALLTPGAYNAAYYEHELMAEALGATIVEGSDLTVYDNVLYRHGGGELHQVDVLYARVSAEWLDPLVFRPDSYLGVPGIISAWMHGNVSIANAPGTGVADDKAIYQYVPEMIRYYLGENPILPNVPTHDLSSPKQLKHVQTHLENMVIKPVDASGGYGVIFGKLLSQEQRRNLSTELAAHPRQYVAQDEVALSKAVCVAPGGGLEARVVDLRPFVLLDEQPWVVPGGLTRVAADPDELIVNSSQGGGSKDTWVLTD
jgi:uncharacterized circularly permuted ATP-grasp superfamily protein